jgi:hypothetical protein
MKSQAFASALIATLASATPDVAFTSIGKFNLKNAAFPAVTSFQGSDPFLLVSSFGALSSGAIYVVPHVAEAVKANNVSKLAPVKLDTPSFEWPNNV